MPISPPDRATSATSQLQAPAASGSGHPTARAPRLRSLDWARGLMLTVSIVANSLLVTPAWFGHAQWFGVHPVDLVFPTFVTLAGCGLAFALRRGVRWLRTLRRIVVLALAGLLYNAVTSDHWDVSTWRVTGVLQLYAVLVALVTIGHLVTRSARGWATVTAVLAAGQAFFLGWWAHGCGDGRLSPTCNPSGVIDAAIFGARHIYVGGARGHDPEGLLSLWGAAICVAAGATAGHALLSLRTRHGPADPGGPAPAGRWLATPTGALLALGLVLAIGAVASAHLPQLLGFPAVPAMKRLWTAPFALGVSALVAWLLMVGHLVLDRRRFSRAVTAAAWPWVALGRNSLLVYFGSHVLVAVLLTHPTGAGDQDRYLPRLADRLAVGDQRQATLSLMLLAGWMALTAVLHRRRLYLRA